ncbi:hypothetical protein HII36_09660 [Nonomuraea sp. NN258]|uniref:hypothetical protein n=1 Tax=Nonomuraea antri TaxID=2730852 RepID=UPI001568D2FB|nr:hypothetical protein [Nonomuraea antri]NRQ32102.1 hypothetical protein [Nonomuraea antri]
MTERWNAERGSVTPYSLIFIVTLMAFAGLAVDGGAKLRAGWEAVGVAEEAARAGAGLVDQAAAYAGRPFVVDAAAGAQAARAYLAKSGHAGTVGLAGPQTVRVTVTVTKSTYLLSMVGISEVTATARTTADLATGVSRRER